MARKDKRRRDDEHFRRIRRERKMLYTRKPQRKGTGETINQLRTMREA